MQANVAELPLNPYASPPLDEPIIRAELADEKPKPGSLPLIFLGFILLLVGYLASNIFAIADLYQIGFGPGGEVIPSPLADVFSTPGWQWLFYGICAAATIAGCILIGSQNFNPLVAVIFIMCPLVAVVYLLAMPLRMAQKWTVPMAATYLMIGTCLAGVGISRLIGLYGQAGLNFEPILASLLTEIGLALLGGAMLKLAFAPSDEPRAAVA
ncbi:MAG TPA: hypothetical protein VFV87_08845 [Pirellulaceae bacterium]|nr:hypothetical protein [Pirellulaceae bacterium]